jgi:hypothetical protein
MIAPSDRGASPRPTTRASPGALGASVAGHLLLLIAAVTDSIPLNTAIVAAIACSIIAVAALTGLAPLAMRVARAVTAVTGGHAAAVAVMLAGLVPRVPGAIPIAALAVAGTLDMAALAAVRHAAPTNRPPRPLLMAPRVAAIALVVEALLQRWFASTTGLSTALRAAIFLALAALGVAQLVSLSVIALRLRPRWAIAGLLAWTVGWVAITADLSSLILWSLGGPIPIGPHQPRQLDPELVQILATVGGLAIGAALVTSIREARFRHAAVVLLAGYAVFGALAAVAEHRIDLATDFPGITALRKDRDLADTVQAFPLAGVLWLYWRRVAVAHLRRGRAEQDADEASLGGDPRWPPRAPQ